MTGWLAGKTVRVEGDLPGLADELVECGALLTGLDDCDVLVHGARAAPARPVHELSHGEWRSALESGLDLRFRLIQQFAAARRAAGKPGAVVFVEEPAEIGGADHAAAVGAIGNLTKSLAVEWARDGIRVNTVLTASRDHELAQLVAYLASDYAAFITGAVLGVRLDDAG